MAKILIMNKFEEASHTKSLQELWYKLSNDQLFELCVIFERVFDRDLDALFAAKFANATAEDSTAMTALIETLGSSIARVNSIICNLNWDECNLHWDKLDAAIEGLHRDAAGHAPRQLAVMQYLTDMLRNYQFYGENNTIGRWELFEFRDTPVS